MYDAYLPTYVTTEKSVGETPLQALERLRLEKRIPKSVPLAYAGRLDPMASGTLLILIGDTCKQQERYHEYDKAYDFEVLFDISSDTGDVLGLLTHAQKVSTITSMSCKEVAQSLHGDIQLPYPHFSSKTVRGKPLHVWTLEGRIKEIEIPTQQSHIYSLTHNDTSIIDAHSLYSQVCSKIETIPLVTEPSKVLGADFRRADIRISWKTVFDMYPTRSYTIARFTAIVSSGTYIRSLAPLIGEKLGTRALAYSIHRTVIGKRIQLGPLGFWGRRF